MKRDVDLSWEQASRFGDAPSMADRIKLGISACLVGQRVRYDGGHAHDSYLTDTIGKFVEFLPVCPEMECGLGTPRDPMHLVGDPASPRLVTIRTGEDLTERMVRYARRRVADLEKEDLAGFIFKARSPSSGMERVKVYHEKGTPVKRGVGIFARVFMEHFPLIPIEDDERLHDPGLRENLIERIFILKRWRALVAEGPDLGRLDDFHTRHELLIMSHSVAHHRELGRLASRARVSPLKALRERYFKFLMESLRIKSTRKKHSRVLSHILALFKKEIAREEKQEALELIEHYRNGDVPLIVPLTLLNHFSRKYDTPNLKEQYYLNPHPVELQLRNHA